MSDSKPAGVSTTSQTLSLVYVCFAPLLDRYERKDDETVSLCSLFPHFASLWLQKKKKMTVFTRKTCRLKLSRVHSDIETFLLVQCRKIDNSVTYPYQ